MGSCPRRSRAELALRDAARAWACTQGVTRKQEQTTGKFTAVPPPAVVVDRRRRDEQHARAAVADALRRAHGRPQVAHVLVERHVLPASRRWQAGQRGRTVCVVCAQEHRDEARRDRIAREDAWQHAQGPARVVARVAAKSHIRTSLVHIRQPCAPAAGSKRELRNGVAEEDFLWPQRQEHPGRSIFRECESSSSAAAEAPRPARSWTAAMSPTSQPCALALTLGRIFTASFPPFFWMHTHTHRDAGCHGLHTHVQPISQPLPQSGATHGLHTHAQPMCCLTLSETVVSASPQCIMQVA